MFKEFKSVRGEFKCFTHNNECLVGSTTDDYLLVILRSYIYKDIQRTRISQISESMRFTALMERQYYFHIPYSSLDELVDFFCGNNWPDNMKEFIDEVVTELTKDQL